MSFPKNKPFKLLITAGPTREHIDPVRFISNLSTGEMGYSLADAAIKKGFEVYLVSGQVSLKPPKNVKFYSVTSAQEMLETCAELFPKCDGLIMTAAVCDFTPVKNAVHKIPSGDGLVLKLKRTTDILAALAKKKQNRFVVGFCLETKDLVRSAKKKIERKNLDGIVANFYKPQKQIPFGKNNVTVSLIDKSGKIKVLNKSAKAKIAHGILSWILEEISFEK